MKYEVTIPYSGEITMEVEASNRDEAIRLVTEELDGCSPSYLMHAIELERGIPKAVLIDEESFKDMEFLMFLK